VASIGLVEHWLDVDPTYRLPLIKQKTPQNVIRKSAGGEGRRLAAARCGGSFARCSTLMALQRGPHQKEKQKVPNVRGDHLPKQGMLEGQLPTT